MAKFVKINGSTDRVVVGLENIILIDKASATEITITYAAADAAANVMTITHTSDSTNTTFDNFVEAINNAMKPSANPENIVDVTSTLPGVSTIVVA